MPAALVLALVASAVLGLMLFDLIEGFIGSTGTLVDRVKGAFRGSVTIFVTQASALVVGVPTVSAEIANLLGDPTWSPFLAKIPEPYADWVPAAIAVLAYVGRLRSAGRET